MTKKHLLLLVILLSGLSQVSVAWAQVFDQVTRPIARLYDTALIQQFLNELFIPTDDSVATIEIIDVTGNGYGLDDTLILYPSREIYHIDYNLPQDMQELMAGWELSSDFQLQSADSVTTATDYADVRGALGIAVVETIDNYYSGNQFDLRISRDYEGISLEMWNYDPLGLAVPEVPPPACGPLTQRWQYRKPIVVRTLRDVPSQYSCIVTSVTDEGIIQQEPCTETQEIR